MENSRFFLRKDHFFWPLCSYSRGHSAGGRAHVLTSRAENAEENIFCRASTREEELRRVTVIMRQHANCPAILREQLHGSGSFHEGKKYSMLKIRARKCQKSVRRLYCGYFTFACNTTHEVIEDLLGIPRRFSVILLYCLNSYDISEVS